ncbi:putative MHC class I antigen protein [Naja naja]|nr:putative MHC class I antigen protein [Naja naja]
MGWRRTSAAWMASTPGRSMPPGEGREEVWEEETFHGFWPQADGTYHSWLSIRIDPKERGYRCHVEHGGLQEPLDLALEEPTNSKSNLGLIIISCVVAALVLALRNVKTTAKHHQNQAVEDGPPFHYSQAVLGSGVLKEKLLGQGNPEEDEKIQLVEGPSD